MGQSAKLILADPLNSSQQVNGETNKENYKGRVSSNSWQVTEPGSSLRIELATDSWYDGRLQVTIRQIDWQKANATADPFLLPEVADKIWGINHKTIRFPYLQSIFQPEGHSDTWMYEVLKWVFHVLKWGGTFEVRVGGSEVGPTV